MAKGFLEVFPGLTIEKEFEELLKLTKVPRVTSTRDRSSIRIYLESPRLIQKQMIYDLENGIKEQLFPGKKMTIKIQEKYCLSGQYTPQKLMEVYQDSIALELKNYSIIMYTMFKKAEFIFPEPDVLQMTVENTMVSREKAGELKRILEKILQERCGMGAVVEFTYVAPKESKLRKQAKEAEEAAAAAYGAYLHGGTGTDLDMNIPWDEYGISGAKSGAAGGQSEENAGGKTGNSEVKTSNAGKKYFL